MFLTFICLVPLPYHTCTFPFPFMFSRFHNIYPTLFHSLSLIRLRVRLYTWQHCHPSLSLCQPIPFLFPALLYSRTFLSFTFSLPLFSPSVALLTSITLYLPLRPLSLAFLFSSTALSYPLVRVSNFTCAVITFFFSRPVSHLVSSFF